MCFGAHLIKLNTHTCIHTAAAAPAAAETNQSINYPQRHTQRENDHKEWRIERARARKRFHMSEKKSVQKRRNLHYHENTK